MATLSPVYRTKLDALTETDDSQVTALAWRTGPGNNSLSIADSSGRVTRWDSVIPKDSNKPHPVDGPPFGTARTTAPAPRPTTAAPSTTTASKGKGPILAEEDIFGDDDDDGWIDDDMNGAYKDGPDAAQAPEAEDDDDELPPPLDGNGITRSRQPGLNLTGLSSG